MPPGEIDTIVKQCKAYDDFCKYRSTSGLKDVLAYGNGYVLLFYGKSGTGKTMTVNAIANELGKSVLLVDFASLTGKRDGTGSDVDADLRGLFREAQMNNAILFFDECEVVFRNRDHGGDRMLNTLLTEIEKHEGIVFLATNRPYDLDGAMHRRINSVTQFKPPDHLLRRNIFNNLLGIENSNETGGDEMSAEHNMSKLEPEISVKKKGRKNSKSSNNQDSLEKTEKVDEKTSKKKCHLNLADDIDVNAIALKYELTGGFIKNAIISAILSAIGRDATNPIIEQKDLVLGCKLQMRGSLRQSSDSMVTSQSGLNAMFCSLNLKKAIIEIIHFEQTRSCVYGTWTTGTSNQYTTNASADTKTDNVYMLDQRACISVFAGPKGAGKHTFANCIGYELNRTVKPVHWVDIVNNSNAHSHSTNEIIRNLEGLLNDARLSDSIVVINGFENIIDDSNINASSSHNDSSSSNLHSNGHNVGGFKLNVLLSRILPILHKFPGCIILMCDVDNPHNIVLQRDFASILFSFIRFSNPPSEIRAQLWKHMIPSHAPLSTTNPINFLELSKKFEFNPGNIRNAITRACAVAASRNLKLSTYGVEKNCIADSLDEKTLYPYKYKKSKMNHGLDAKTGNNDTLSTKSVNAAVEVSAEEMKLNHTDLLKAGEYELLKLKGNQSETMLSLFV